MDAKVTLSFDHGIAEQAKAFAASHNISLSRLVEFMLTKATEKRYRTLDELPISDWVGLVAEGEATYVRKNAADRDLKKEYLAGRKR